MARHTQMHSSAFYGNARLNLLHSAILIVSLAALWHCQCLNKAPHDVLSAVSVPQQCRPLHCVVQERDDDAHWALKQ